MASSPRDDGWTEDNGSSRTMPSQQTHRPSSADKVPEVRYSVDLWDGFSAIFHRAEVGSASLKNVLAIFKKRALMEEAYAKSLQELYKKAYQETSSNMVKAFFQSQNAVVTESGTIRNAWHGVLESANLVGRAHSEFSRNVNENVISQLSEFIKDYDIQMKKMSAQGKNYVSEYEAAIKNVEKAKQGFDKIHLEEELAAISLDLANKDASVKPKEYQKLNQKAVLLRERVEAASQDYEEALRVANETQRLFHNIYMPSLLDEFQHWETIRMRIIKSKVKQFIIAEEPLPEELTRCRQVIEIGLARIDPARDVADFVYENKSYKSKPEPYQFEPYVSPIDPEDPQSVQRLLSRVSKKSSARAANEIKAMESAVRDEPKPETSVFGRTLDEVMRVQRELFPESESAIPFVQHVLTEQLFVLDATGTEGIFRVPASLTAVEELKKHIDSGNYEKVKDVDDVSLIAAVLKLWFRELAEPLVPSSLYSRAIESPKCVAPVLDELPKINREVIKYLVAMLNRLSKPEHVAVTRMNESNLAMVFAPSVLRCPSSDPGTVLGNVAFEKEFVLSLIHPN